MLRTLSFPVILLVLLAHLGATEARERHGCPPLPQSAADEDARVSQLIKGVRAVAEKIVIDGQGADWDGVPSVRDRGPRLAVAHLDLYEARVAPLPDALLLFARTAKPIRDGTVWVTLDLVDDEAFDCAFELTEGVRTSYELYGQDRKVSRGHVSGIEVRHGTIVEARIPLAALEELLPESKKGLRRWVRARFLTWESTAAGERRIDRGLSVASYRLDVDLGAPSSKESGARKFVLSAPLVGEFYLSQGPHSSFSHRSLWAYDFDRRDAAHRAHKGGGDYTTKDLADFYAFHQSVRSPVQGQVITCQKGSRDQAPGSARQRASNHLVVETRRGYRVVLTHLAEGSIVVEEGDRVTGGQPLARIGNSGYSESPHLHLEVESRGESVPIAFRNVQVKLNRGPCAWERHLATWEPEEGFFIVARP